MHILINDRLISAEEAVISPFDHGFLYGMGLFETFRVYDGHPFLLDDHLDRLNRGLSTLNIEAAFSREELAGKISMVLERNGCTNANVRLNVSAGIEELGLPPDVYSSPQTILFARPLPPAGEMAEKQLVLLKMRRNTPEGDERLKSHHYMNNILAKRELGNTPGQEGIFLTKEGFLAEGVVSNLFWTKGNILYTPSLETGILNGITRQFVLLLAEKNGLQVQEGFYQAEEMMRADEVFVTNSIQEIAPAASFAGVSFPGGAGRLAGMLHKEYRKYSSHLWGREGLLMEGQR
ncbi:aminodeoxychorismate lyase [Bacillus sp. UMB0728]|uniref:aminodeoxychorismate lyase n=1 Tax=Bacillus sp. UMB0728 TaxID=2066052 RepID=UPI000C7824FA|nr:aminodeoxychorismate lyase [Bacillus sp. UMB0728]PLR70005.1 4-amino-4-deoxychorismate lyase [Bacillus sp. UMB0728]